MSGDIMSTLIAIIIGVSIGVYIYLRMKHQGQEYGAAKNALMAKYTFPKFDQNSKENVEKVTIDMLSQGIFLDPIDTLKSMSERARYGFYAMAMVHLGIEPLLGKESWLHVENHFVALINAELYINDAGDYLKKNYNIDIPIS